MAVRSLLAIYEPNAIVEISSTDVTIKDDKFFARKTISVRTSHLRRCLRKRMRDKASEGWLHRCSCRRENQAQSLREFLNPPEL